MKINVISNNWSYQYRNLIIYYNMLTDLSTIVISLIDMVIYLDILVM